DPATIALLQNADVLAVHREGHGAREVFREDPLILWTADGPAGEHYIAAFNVGEQELTVALDSQNVGLPAALEGEVTELWSGRAVPMRPVAEQSDAARGVAPGSTALDVVIPRHGAVLLEHRPQG
ncbi:MAG TPA: alpha-galactosidase, partial [Brevibacterium sp.]|nr:alpha-galactosidase [Brevibacterium sp.]